MTYPKAAQRKEWFRYFPEGSIEFIAVLRVLAIMLMTALLVVGGTQRPIVLTTIGVVLWADYALMIWWLLQMRDDLDGFFADSEPRPPTSSLRDFLLVLVPVSAAACLLTPWPVILFPFQATRSAVQMVGIPVLLLVYIAGIATAQRVLRRRGLSTWQALSLLLPVVHWIGMHRALPDLKAKVRRVAEARGYAQPDFSRLSTLIAEVSLIVAAGFWLLVPLSGDHVTTIGRLMYVGGHLGGIVFGAIFAIANVAAMEQVQRGFVSLVRRL